MSSRTNLIWAILTGIAILLPSLISDAAAADAKSPPYLRLPVEGIISTIDPGLTRDEVSIEITEQLFLGLTDFDPETYEPVPELATHWDISEDGTTYRFYLRDDVRWTNGEPVTAHDIVWAVRRNIQPETDSPYAYMIYILENAQAVSSGTVQEPSAVGVRAADDLTVEFHIKYPAAYFPAMVSSPVFRPLPRKTVQKYGDQWTAPRYIQTNGSYVLSSWKKGNVMVLRKNPDYFDADSVSIPEVRYHIVPESYAGLVMYEHDHFDIIGGKCLRLPFTEIPRIKSDPVLGQEYRVEPNFSTYAYGFNTRRPPVDDVLVRKAICAAIDRRMLIEVIGEEREPATTFTRPPIFGSVSPTEGVGIRFDPGQAKQWLAQAGYPGGEGFPRITLIYNVSEVHQKIAEAIQSFLAHYLNIRVLIRELEWNAFVEAASQPNAPHIFRMGWGADYPDANNFLSEVLHPFDSPNQIGWENQEFADLMDRAQRDTDPEQRKAFYKRAEQILTEEECGILPVYFETAQYLVKPRVKGWYHMAVGGQHIRNWGFYEAPPLPVPVSTDHRANQTISEGRRFMIGEFLTRTYYGNTIWQWVATMVLIALAVLVGKILYWISANVIKKLTEKTETKLDDILVDMIEEPLVLAGVLVAIWYSLKLLTLPPAAAAWVSRLFYIFVIFDIAWMISRTVDALVEHYIVPLTEKTETDLDDVLLPMARNIFRFVVWSLAVILGLNNAGYDVGAIIAGLGIGGLAVAMAAKDVLANLIGGASLMMSRPFKTGDRVRVGKIEGWIREIGLRVTVIHDFYGRKIIVPNKVFTETPIENIDKQPNYMQLMTLRLHCDTPPAKIQSAMDILKDTALRNKHVEDTVWISLDKIGEYSLDIEFWYGVRLWKPEDQETIGGWYHKIARAKTEMHMEILRRFQKESINLALPTGTKRQARERSDDSCFL